MPLTQEDVKFVLAVMPNVAAMQKAVESIGTQIKSVAEKSGKILQDELIKGMTAAGKLDAASLDPWKQGMARLQTQRAIEASVAERSKAISPASHFDVFADTLKKKGIGAALGDVFGMLKGDIGEQIGGLKEAHAKGGIPGLLKAITSGGKGVNPGQMLGSIAGGYAEGGIVGALGAGVGGIAGAMGGPIGMAVSAALVVIPAVLKKTGEAIAIPAKLMAAGLNIMGKALSDVQGPLGPFGAGLSMASGAIKTLSSLLPPVVKQLGGPFLDALGMIPAALEGIFSAVPGIVAKASPAAYKMWEMALEDTIAVIGHALVPMLQMMTSGMRKLGDALVSNGPAIERIGAMFGNLFEGLVDIGIKVLPFVLANFQLLGIGLYALAAPLIALSKALDIVRNNAIFRIAAAIATGGTSETILAMTGTRGTPGSSVGAAARPAQMQSTESYITGLQVAAFSQGIDPARRTADASEKTNVLLQQLILLSGAGPIGVAAIQRGARVLSPMAQQATESARQAVGGGVAGDIIEALLAPGNWALRQLGG
jgi:hypothetical protein